MWSVVLGPMGSRVVHCRCLLRARAVRAMNDEQQQAYRAEALRTSRAEHASTAQGLLHAPLDGGLQHLVHLAAALYRKL